MGQNASEEGLGPAWDSRKAYWKHRAAYLHEVVGLQPLGSAITNSSPALAQGVLEFDGQTGIIIIDDDTLRPSLLPREPFLYTRNARLWISKSLWTRTATH